MSSLFAYAQPPKWSVRQYLTECLEYGTVLAQNFSVSPKYSVLLKGFFIGSSVIWGVLTLGASAATYLITCLWDREGDIGSIVLAIEVICTYIVLSLLGVWLLLTILVATLNLLGQ